MLLNFWRPIDKIVHANPLAVCDPTSINAAEDVVMVHMTKHESPHLIRMALKYKPRHEWYYFPQMTREEVLVMKLLEVYKTDGEDSRPPIRCCFHGAFQDPNTLPGVPDRNSTEYRVLVFVGDRKE